MKKEPVKPEHVARYLLLSALAVDWLPLLLLAQQNPVLIDWLGSILIDPKCQYITPSLL